MARRASAILRDDGRGLFLFVVTMENHGPWLADDPRRALPDLAPGLPDLPGRDELRCFLNGLKHTDAMLGAICDTLGDGRGGLVAAYGDHLPSLSPSFRALGFDGSATDYVVWSPRGGAGARRDLAAHELPSAILAAREGLR